VVTYQVEQAVMVELDFNLQLLEPQLIMLAAVAAAVDKPMELVV
jgi:hypothetical protein